MSIDQLVRIGFTLGVLTLPATVARAEGVPLKRYDVKEFRVVTKMGRELAQSRDQLDSVLFTLASAKNQLARAQKAKDEAARRYGPNSHDAEITSGRYLKVKRDMIQKALSELQVALPQLKSAETENRRRVRELLKRSGNFRQLVKGHLENRRNPVVLATLVYLASTRLSVYAETLYGNVVLGKIDADMKQLKRTMDLVGQLLDPNATTTTLQEVWDELDPELGNALSAEPSDAIDELDSLLAE